MNYFDEWFSDMQVFMWKEVLQNDPYFRNLAAIKLELEEFFDKTDFDSTNPNPDNWLFHILANKQISSIYTINETAELLRWLKGLPDQNLYHLKNKEGKINYKALQEKLYEIYIRYIFTSAGFNPITGQTYLSSSGFSKEIDLFLEIHSGSYNIEITKFYDVFKEELVALAADVLQRIASTVIKRQLNHDETFSGFFAFKVRDWFLIKKNKQLMGQQIKKYLDGYRASKDKLVYPPKIETDQFEFKLESVFNNNFDNHYDTYLKPFPASIKFRVTADIKTNKGHLESQALSRETIADQNERLQIKIKEKLKQHKESPHPLLIIMAIEKIFSTHIKNKTISIGKKDIDTVAIHRLISNKAAVIFIFKEVEGKSIHYKKMILGNSIKHAELFQIFDKLDPVVRYMPISSS